MTLDEVRERVESFRTAEPDSDERWHDKDEVYRLTLLLLDYYATHGRHCTSGNCGVCRGCTTKAAITKALEEM